MNRVISDFSRIDGICIVTWELETKTPLCIKSGTTSLWNQASSERGKAVKLRRIDAEYDFFHKTIDKNAQNEASISDFYYDVAISGEDLKIQHRIPASGVRGALRSYTIRRLTKKDMWNAALLPAVESDEIISEEDRKKYLQNLKEALKTPGWHLIRNLFGLAADTDDPEIEKESVAGRLQVEVGDLAELSGDEFQQSLFDGNFSKDKFKVGPTNGRMLFTTRNPIDRVTHAAKDGGLHSFTELAPGNRFSVTLRIANPDPPDLGFIALWEQGINQGLLRLGGLSGAGRGRLYVHSTTVNLFLCNAGEFKGLEPSSALSASDVLGGMYPEYVITEWKTFLQHYLNELKQQFNALQRGQSDE